MADEVSILGFAGSLRRQSYNRAALRAAVKLVPSGITLNTFDLDGIPPFNQDHEKEPPNAVREFKAAILRADGILSSDLLAIDARRGATGADCVVIVTDHKNFNYSEIVECAPLIVDTRNALKGNQSKNIVRL